METRNKGIYVQSVAIQCVAGTEETIDLGTEESSLGDPGKISCCIDTSTFETFYQEIRLVVERAISKAGCLGERVGMVVASNFLESFQNEKQFDGKNFQETNDAVEKIYEEKKLTGPLIINSTACSSGGSALITACELLKDGMADSILVIGFEAKNQTSLNGMKRIGALTTDRISPFSLERSGTALAEGIGVIILRAEECKKNPNGIARIAGYGLYADGYNVTSPNPDGSSLYLAMNQALEQSGVAKDQVIYINTHGSGTKMNDKMETMVIQQVFAEHASNIYINSTKSLVGHTLGASEIIEFIFTVLQMQKKCIHATVNYQTYDADCYLNCCANQSVHTDIPYAMTNSIGFGGINVSLLLENSRFKEDKNGK